MRYNNHQNNRRGGHGGYRSHGGGQSYVWRVRWWNPNVNGGFDQYKSFRSKAEALIFKAKKESNWHNRVYGPEKVED